MARIKIEGTQVHSWNVLEYVGDKKYKCQCECGTIKIIDGGDLRRAKTKSCGCFQKNNPKIKHGLSAHIHYQRAVGILQRCNDVNNHNYENYGKRGIKCLLGETIEEVVLSLDSIDGYVDGLSIDRIDNNGNYEIGNLKWSNQREQTLNRRTKTQVEIDKNLHV